MKPKRSQFFFCLWERRKGGEIKHQIIFIYIKRKIKDNSNNDIFMIFKYDISKYKNRKIYNTLG